MGNTTVTRLQALNPNQTHLELIKCGCGSVDTTLIAHVSWLSRNRKLGNHSVRDVAIFYIESGQSQKDCIGCNTFNDLTMTYGNTWPYVVDENIDSYHDIFERQAQSKV